jgi:hypothetical protein
VEKEKEPDKKGPDTITIPNASGSTSVASNK